MRCGRLDSIPLLWEGHFIVHTNFLFYFVFILCLLANGGLGVSFARFLSCGSRPDGEHQARLSLSVYESVSPRVLYTSRKLPTSRWTSQMQQGKATACMFSGEELAVWTAPEIQLDDDHWLVPGSTNFRNRKVSSTSSVPPVIPVISSSSNSETRE
jgi:hypothetical protein